MSLIKPFRGLRPTPDHAADVVAPPYDVLNTEEARQRAQGRAQVTASYEPQKTGCNHAPPPAAPT